MTPKEILKVEKEIVLTLKNIYDPEIPVNIYDLGLIYEIDVEPGGEANIRMTLTRNPWHVREYNPDQLRNLLGSAFASVEALGVFGNERIMEYYEKNRQGVRRITRFDVLDLQHRLPRWMLQLPYDLLNRLNRRRLLRDNDSLTRSITMEDYRIGPVADDCFDLFYIAEKQHK